ncbi:OFA family MFS transporter [Psychromicrobium xiongbiense]|uniref:L-lactate MFS transporter n=1 Tax=Psychromicrobium xiongbiense TaxID=3051184 RepID=UPI0025571C0B|nr:OFA family MFS transporter [Psychromicrobium sp. YIM S02556]
MSWLSRERIVARPGFNRWLIPPAALAVHLCIGQAYATSVYKTSLVKYFGVDQTSVGIIFSIAIVMLGLSSAIMGTWVDKNGPRKAMFTAACFWASGFMVGAIGIFSHQLWLLYLGYGVIGGIGLGIGYISPVSTLMKWFPDHPGVATGLAIMGFGGGALIASPVEANLMKFYDPSGNDPGSAVGKLFITLGIVYFLYMLFGSWLIRVPADGWKPQGFNPATVKAKALITTANVSANNAIKTPQFWLLWVALFCNITAGIGILEEASPMIQDFFPKGSAGVVTAAAAAGFVGFLSLGNMLGRLGWSSASDTVGRKRMYMIYLGIGAIIYVLLTLFGATSPALFVLFALVIISFYGGGFATAPAYLRDLFGTYQVGAIHGRLLTAWSVAGVVGPLIVNGFLDSAHASGKPLTADSYHPAFITMICILAVGFVANLLIRPVSSRFFEPASASKVTVTSA